PDPFEDAVPGFADRGVAAGVGEPGCFVEGQLGDGVAFGLGRFDDVVVGAGDGDSAVRVVESGEQGGEGARRVGDGAAEGAAVQVGAGAVDVDLAVGEAAHAHAHRRGVRTPHGGVGDDDDIAGQPGAVAGE